MNDNEQIIRNFIAAGSQLDADKLFSYCASEGVYHNMPAEPVAGHEALKQFIGGFIKPWTKTTWDILNITASGDLVFVERLDRTELGEIKVDLPCCGVIEMEDGKIKIWRDYFDMATYTKPLGG